MLHQGYETQACQCLRFQRRPKGRCLLSTDNFSIVRYRAMTDRVYFELLHIVKIKLRTGQKRIRGFSYKWNLPDLHHQHSSTSTCRYMSTSGAIAPPHVSRRHTDQKTHTPTPTHTHTHTLDQLTFSAQLLAVLNPWLVRLSLQGAITLVLL